MKGFNVLGLLLFFTTALSAGELEADDDNPTRICTEFGLTQFQITSTAQCISANHQYSRVISVEVIDGHF